MVKQIARCKSRCQTSGPPEIEKFDIYKIMLEVGRINICYLELEIETFSC